jgi:tetratricopeptide (TPR) repeat protein
LEAEPRYIKAWYGKAVALGALENYQEVLKAYDKALELDPDFDPALKAKNDILESKEQ